MTGLSNDDIVAQLGWTLQIIYNSTGGRLARYWRPPYGDTDLRVNAIAQEVFGLNCIIWNHEYVLCLLDRVVGVPILFSALETGNSVHLAGPPQNRSRLTCSSGSQVPPYFRLIPYFSQNTCSGPQSPGLVILEHELSEASVTAFMTAFPLFKQYNWNLQSVATMNGGSAYQNANGDTGAPVLVPLTAAGLDSAGLAAATATTSSTSTPPSPTTSEAGRASAVPASGVKSNGVAPMLRSCSLTSMLSVALALSLCLI
jgi:chitin deacetylase